MAWGPLTLLVSSHVRRSCPDHLTRYCSLRHRPRSREPRTSSTRCFPSPPISTGGGGSATGCRRHVPGARRGTPGGSSWTPAQPHSVRGLETGVSHHLKQPETAVIQLPRRAAGDDVAGVQPHAVARKGRPAAPRPPLPVSWHLWGTLFENRCQHRLRHHRNRQRPKRSLRLNLD